MFTFNGDFNVYFIETGFSLNMISTKIISTTHRKLTYTNIGW